MLPDTLPDPHRDFLQRSLAVFETEPALVGVALGGSGLAGQMDEFSDLDLVLVVEDAARVDMLARREAFAARLGELLAAFTGEHVGEPRLLICLYASGPLHVDLKFLALSELLPRVEQPRVIWEREGRLSGAYTLGAARSPGPDAQWLEDRFWVWVHYCATKIGRGELFEAIDCLGFLRAQVLGPLLLQAAGRRPAGVRKIERYLPQAVPGLAATVPTYDAVACVQALRETVQRYRALRDGAALRLRAAAEAAACAYVERIAAREGAPAA